MKVSSEKMENCQLRLNVEAEAGELEKSLNEAYHRMVSKVSISGFRKGKAPRAILEQYIGRDALLREALERLIPQLYEQAIASQQIEAIAAPQIELTQNEPLIFTAIVPLKPEVKLGDYHHIRVEPEPVEVGDKEIAAAIEGLRQQQAVLLPVERPVQPGDVITISVAASVAGKPFLNHKDLVYEVDSNSTFPLPGFASNLHGTKKNEERIFTVNVPDEYSIKEFCGQECRFKVMVTEIKEKQLPQLDDEFAQSCNYADLAQLKEKVVAYLRTKAEEKNRLELRRKAVDAVVELSQADYPPVLEDREIDALLGEEARQLGYQQVRDYLERVSQTEEKLRQELRPVARRRVVNTLVLDKVAEEEKIEITPAEVDNKVEEIINKAEDKKKMQQFFALAQVRKSIGESLRTEKSIDWLVQIASGNSHLSSSSKGEELKGSLS